MGVQDWDWNAPVELQDYPWDCSAASLAWCLQAIGLPMSEQDVIYGLGPGRISPVYGLLDASGAGLVSYLADIGIGASNNAWASWADVTAAAGFQPMLIGGRTWCHWTGVRMGRPATNNRAPDVLLLANPAPGYQGVYQVLNQTYFDALGDFSAVWLTSW